MGADLELKQIFLTNESRAADCNKLIFGLIVSSCLNVQGKIQSEDLQRKKSVTSECRTYFGHQLRPLKVSITGN